MGTELPAVEVLDVFVLDDHGQLRAPAPAAPDPPELRRAAHDAVRHLQEVKATPGHRLGSDPGTVIRLGLGEEIYQPVLIRAEDALARLEDGVLFTGLPGFDVDLDSRQVRGWTATWDAQLDTGPPRGNRAAVLRVRPTPSRTVTVIELVPVRPRRFATRSFVRVGVQAIAELGGRLRAA